MSVFPTVCIADEVVAQERLPREHVRLEELQPLGSDGYRWL
jgi:hypothetical protein